MIDSNKYLHDELTKRSLPSLLNSTTKYPPESLDARCLANQRTVAMQAIQLDMSKNTPPITFGFVNDPGLDAVAFVGNPEAGGPGGCIAVYFGAAMLIRDLFYRMLSHPAVLTEYGDPGKEQASSFHQQGLEGDYDVLMAKRPGSSGLADVCPKDVIRKGLADDLTLFAWSFLIRHELAHLRCGHCGWLNNTRGISSVSERNPNKGAGDEANLDFQCIDVDADSSAFGRLVSQGMAGAVSRGSTVNPEVVKNDPVAHVSFLAQFSVSALFMLFDSASSDAGQGARLPARLRSRLCIDAGGRFVRRFHTKDVQDTYDRTSKQVWKTAVEACQVLGRAAGQGEIAELDKNSPARANERRILDRWKSLRRELEPFAIGKSASQGS